MLGFCCGCLPLQIGCITIGIFLVLVSLIRLYMVIVLHALVKQRDDGTAEEEVILSHYFYPLLVYHGLQLAAGCLIVLASFLGLPRCLKLCSLIVCLLALSSLGVLCSDLSAASFRDSLSAVLTCLLMLYLAFVLCSYAQELVDPRGPPIMFVTTLPYAYDPRDSYDSRRSRRSTGPATERTPSL